MTTSAYTVLFAVTVRLFWTNMDPQPSPFTSLACVFAWAVECESSWCKLCHITFVLCLFVSLWAVFYFPYPRLFRLCRWPMLCVNLPLSVGHDPATRCDSRSSTRSHETQLWLAESRQVSRRLGDDIHQLWSVSMTVHNDSGRWWLIWCHLISALSLYVQIAKIKMYEYRLELQLMINFFHRLIYWLLSQLINNFLCV